MRSDARRAPTTFLYATESRLRSSSERSSTDAAATFFMYSTISSYRSACSASFAMYTLSSDIGEARDEGATTRRRRGEARIEIARARAPASENVGTRAVASRARAQFHGARTRASARAALR